MGLPQTGKFSKSMTITVIQYSLSGFYNNYYPSPHIIHFAYSKQVQQMTGLDQSPSPIALSYVQSTSIV